MEYWLLYVVTGRVKVVETMREKIVDIFDFEELTAEMLGITDEQREDDDYLPDKFYEKFDIDFELAFEFAKKLLIHTVPIEAGLSKKHFHAFVSRKSPVMLMKIETSD